MKTESGEQLHPLSGVHYKEDIMPVHFFSYVMIILLFCFVFAVRYWLDYSTYLFLCIQAVYVQ